jgi:hypothetical protein
VPRAERADIHTYITLTVTRVQCSPVCLGWWDLQSAGTVLYIYSRQSEGAIIGWTSLFWARKGGGLAVL